MSPAPGDEVRLPDWRGLPGAGMRGEVSARGFCKGHRPDAEGLDAARADGGSAEDANGRKNPG